MMGEVQIIDAESVFYGGLELDGVDVEGDGSGNYGVVAVIGCQSSGKSTLLNTAFGTNFPVLDPVKHGRRRTTVGK